MDQQTIEFSGSFDLTSLSSWTTSALLMSTQCGPYNMIGGPYNFNAGDYVSKSFTFLLPHYQIAIYVEFYKIDNWNNNYFKILTGSTVIYSKSFSTADDNIYIRNLCAGCYNEDFIDVFTKYSYTANSITLKLTTDLTSSQDAYWGFNNFQVSYYKCYPTCYTCSDGTINGCITCYGNAAINTGACVCIDGMYMQINSNPCTSLPCSQCNTCDSTCKTCSAAGSSACLSCNNGNYLIGTTCLACSSSCMTCNANSTNCTSCNSGKFLVTTSDSWSCESTCPHGTYGDTGSNICKPCDSNCASCIGLSTNCSDCNIKLYLSSGTCLACDTTCYTCTIIPTNCTSCYNLTYLLNNLCSSTCPAGYASRTSDNTCQLCDTTCVTCTDLDSSHCSSCSKSGYYLSPTPTGSCIQCDISCKTCITTSKSCLSCNTGQFYYNNGCITTCPAGYWARSTDNTCQTCLTSCTTCSAGTSSDCTSCPTGTYLSTTPKGSCLSCSGCATCITLSTNCLSCTSPKFLSNYQCISTCPDGTWPKTTNQTCTSCDATCKTCISPGTSTSCSTCNDGFFLTTTFTCDSCSTICKTCVTTYATCLSCNSGSFLSGTNCILTCPDGTYGDTLTGKCLTCDSSCKTCIAPGDSASCQSCMVGVLYGGLCVACTTPCSTCNGLPTNCTACSGTKYLYNNQCIDQCPNGYYMSISDNICYKCNVACLTCQGEFASDCLTCADGTVLVSGRCSACDVTCLTCNGMGSTNCLSCESSFYLEDSSCVSLCKTGYYMTDTPKKECIRCSSTCTACISNDFNKCVICADNCYFTINDPISNTGSCTYLTCPYSLIMNPDNFTCVSSCDSGKYLDTQYNLCKTCVTPCSTCTAGTSRSCSSCSGAYYLLNTSCVLICPTTYYQSIITNTCEKCPMNCDICLNNTYCTTCSFGYYLYPDNNSCVNTTNNGEFVNPIDGTVKKCSYGCAVCLNYSTCTNCQSLFFLTEDGNCIEETHIEPLLTKDDRADNLFFLSFNDTWNNFFNNLTSNVSSYNLSLENAEIGSYVMNFRYYQFSLLPTWQIIIDFNKNCTDIMNLTLDLFPLEENPYSLTKYRVFIEVPPYIINNTSIVYVEPFLTYISESNLQLNLSFSQDFQDFFIIMKNVTSLAIEGLSSKSFNYTIQNTSQYPSFLVNLSMYVTVLGKPLLNISFDIPGYIIYHPTKRLTRKYVTINLVDYYILDSKSSAQIKYMSEIENTLGYVMTNLAFTHGLLNLGSMSYMGLGAINIIKFLRYIQVSYPPQALLIFQGSLSDIKFFDLSTNNENLDKMPLNYLKYGIQSNFYTNANDKILKILIVLVLAIIFQSISLIYKKNQTSCMARGIHMVAVLFFLNALVVIYLAYLMDLCFYCYINMRFYFTESSIGVLGLITSIGFIIITLVVFGVLFKMILGKNAKIIPVFKNKEMKKNFNQTMDDEALNTMKYSKISPLSADTTSNKIDKGVKRKTWWNVNMEENTLNAKNTCVKAESQDDDITPTSDRSHNNAKISENKEKFHKKPFNQISENSSNSKIMVLLIDFQQESRTQKLYVMFIMIRYIILPVIVVIFYEYTYFLIGCYFSFNFLYLAYILCMQPFSTWWIFIHNIFIEGGIMVAIGGALKQYLDESKGNYDYDASMFNGWLIYYGNIWVIACLISIYAMEIMIKLAEKFWDCCHKSNKVMQE